MSQARRFTDTHVSVDEQEPWAVEGLLRLLEGEAEKLGLRVGAPTVTLHFTVEHDTTTDDFKRFLRAIGDRHVIFETQS